jgi:hypothetical protein
MGDTWVIHSPVHFPGIFSDIYNSCFVSSRDFRPLHRKQMQLDAKLLKVRHVELSIQSSYHPIVAS